jgi:hypothetical protein
VLCGLQAYDVPVVKEYFGILVIVVLIAPIVVLFLYMERRQKGANQSE